MTIAALKAEITTDPLARGYSGMTDQQVVDSLHVQDRSQNLASLTGDVMFQQTDATEFAALTDVKKQLWLAMCGRSDIDPFAPANVAFVQWVFGAGSATITALSAARKTTVDRATELGLGLVRVGEVQQARM